MNRIIHTKYTFFLSFAGVFLFQVSGVAQIQFTIKGLIEGAENRKIYLRYRQNLVDSIYSTDGHFSFAYRSTEPDVYIINVQGYNGGKQVFVEEGVINVEGNASRLSGCEVSGSKEHELFSEMQRIRMSASATSEEIQQELKAFKAKDTLTIKSLHAVYDERSRAAEQLLSAFIKEHADSYVGAHMLINGSGSGSAYWEKQNAYYELLSPQIKKSVNAARFLSNYTTALATMPRKPAKKFAQRNPRGNSFHFLTIAGNTC